MRNAARTKICVLINAIGLLGIICFVLITADLQELFKFGPSEDLIIVSVKIDNWPKYIGLVIVICVIKILEVGVNDIGSPNLGFSIYDPTRADVYGFHRTELQLLANAMFMVNSLGYVFKTMVIVSRVDVAIISVLTGELASAATIYYLLSKKENFYPQFDTENEKKKVDTELNDINIKIDM